MYRGDRTQPSMCLHISLSFSFENVPVKNGFVRSENLTHF